jgi:ferritin
VPAERFVTALNDQITAELAASHQYAAIAITFDGQTLPRLAGFFYAQAVEERNHAMMMARYLLDVDCPVRLGAVDAPRGDFADHIEPIRLALEQERSVSARISELAGIARDEGDYRSEQFIQWFLKEQVEEEATMSALLEVAERVRDFPMTLEEYVAREHPAQEGPDPSAPPAAGGAV